MRYFYIDSNYNDHFVVIECYISKNYYRFYLNKYLNFKTRLFEPATDLSTKVYYTNSRRNAIRVLRSVVKDNIKTIGRTDYIRHIK
jgi:hypothetical protein